MSSSANTGRLTEAELLKLGPLPLESIFRSDRVKTWRSGTIVLGELDLYPLKNDRAAIASLLYFSLEFSWEVSVFIAAQWTAEPWWVSRQVADLYGADLRLPTSRAEALADRERADERARREAQWAHKVQASRRSTSAPTNA